MEKRVVTENDLLNHPQLGEKGVKEGDEHTFNEEGFPVDDAEEGPGEEDEGASGEGTVTDDSNTGEGQE